METETLSNYDQKHINNAMDVDISNNEDDSASPVNKTYEDSTESADIQDNAEPKEAENEGISNKNTGNTEAESDSECGEEEEEEKLMLSPARSDKAYDSDDAGEPLSPPLNRDLDESDNDIDKEESKESDNEVSKNSGSDNDRTEISDNSKSNENDEDNPREATVEVEENDPEKEDQPEEPAEVEENNSEKEDPVEVEENNSKKADKLEKAVEDEENKPKKRKIDRDQAEENETNEDSLAPEENRKEDNDESSDKIVPKDDDDEGSKAKEVEEKIETETENVEEEKKTKTKKVGGEKTETKDDKEDGKGEKAELKDVNEEKEENQDCMIVKDASPKPDSGEKDAEEADEEMEMDEDFDPSLLCPELSMEVDEAPVITASDAPPPESDGNKSPLHLYDPIFSTFVDEMTGAEVDFDLTTEELDLKIKTYGPKNPVQFTKIHCTACNVHLGSALDGQGNRFVHPLLKVLICKKCYHFYTSGEFEKDEDGSELYCRWCGQGGQVMCCSNCEMVFCKKCIRINFDRKKLLDISRSDDWMCFKCNPSQLIHLRIHCAEFMEYIQTELRKAGSSANVDAFMNTDYCQCCIPQKKKPPSETPATTVSRKRKRNPAEEDPDYDPTKDREIPPNIPFPNVMPSTSQQVSPRPVFTPRVGQITPNARPNLMRPTAPGQMRPRMPGVPPTAVRPQNSAGFVKVAGGVRIMGSQNTITPARPPTLRPIRPAVTSNAMKHEWFEKTVRAAARVNSNLSYTLTQLNRAQQNAGSIEALAVVHNKLQEILSSSINSLIQIRKNLRTEFIAGIKNIRFPAKTTPTTSTPATTPSGTKDDDDVIFIPSDPTPPPLVSVNSKIKLPPSISILKKSSNTASTSKTTPATSSVSIKTASGSNLVAKKSTSASDDSSRPKGFLRVKSFSALQSVPSECITIPDDPVDEDEPKIVEETDPLAVCEIDMGKKDNTKDTTPVAKDTTPVAKDTTSDVKESTDKKDAAEDTPKKSSKKVSATNGLTNGGEKAKEKDKVEEKGDDGEKTTKSPGTIKKEKEEALKPAKIILQRSDEIESMVKNKFELLVNGNKSD